MTIKILNEFNQKINSIQINGRFIYFNLIYIFIFIFTLFSF